MLYFHTWLRGAPFESEYRALAVLTVLLMIIIYNAIGVYQLRLTRLERLSEQMKAWLIVITMLVVIGFVTKTSTAYSREVILSWSVTGYVVQVVSFFFVSYVQRQQTTDHIRTGVIGTGNLAKHIAYHLNQNQWLPDKFIGFVTTSDTQAKDEITLGSFEDIATLVEQHQLQRIYIALPMGDAQDISEIYRQLYRLQLDVIWVPDINSLDLLNHSIRELGGVPVISLSETPLIGSNAFLKSVLDYSFAGTALLAAAPIMIATAIAIKLSSPGPVFFRQIRHGWNGERIEILKFRSMKQHTEESGTVTQATRDDSRVTAVGRFIRKTSIDELPQLFNVLSGDMSVVGPRPHAVEHDQFYGEQIIDYIRRHRVKPGITGLAQVNGFRGETRNIEDMERRIDYDLEYINNWSIWLDLKIIVKTAFVLIDKNAY
ncbi:MAG: undecaprenyl-phosphate glucose phosphotransferase [Pseudomonadales bacterium]|nr:undecaprenyl-phosphate glucose phosphotransferase [Pseudomonadales bacterium]